MTRPIHFMAPDQRTHEMIPWSDGDLDQMSQISDNDRRKADAYWRRYLPKRLRNILNARSRGANDAFFV